MSSALRHVENYLSSLSTLASNTASLQDPQALVQDLRIAVFQEIPEEEVSLCSSLLFASENNLLRFLDRTVSVQDKFIVKTKEEILIFIEEYVSLLGKRVSEYALDIKNTCVNVFRREISNTVKQATFGPILKILRLKLSHLDGEKLGVADMAKIYFNEFTCGKSSATVKGSILELLGVLSEQFPELLFHHSSQLVQLLLDCLGKHFKSTKPDLKVIAGSFRGLRSLLVHFSGDLTKSPKNLQTLYRYLCLGLEPPEHLQRYEIPKAALQLLAAHAELFKQYLTEDSENMYRRLSALCQRKNSKFVRVAFTALEAFLGQVGSELVSDARTPESNMQTFRFFVRTFFELLESTHARSMTDVSLAVRGFGRLAGPIREYSGASELKKILGKLFHMAEQYYGGMPDRVEGTILHLASFMGAFANILMQLPSDSIEDAHLDHLERLVGAFFVIYPQLHDSQLRVYYESLTRLFVALYSKGGALSALLSRIVLLGLTLSCSPLPEVANVPPTVTPAGPPLPLARPLYQQYRPLWLELLRPRPPPDLRFAEASRKELASQVYDALIQAILKLVQRLDFGYTVAVAAGDAMATDITRLLCPNAPKDLALFLNLVEFCKTVLPRGPVEFFPRWAYIFAREVIVRSNQHPLISGLYKLLTVVLRLCDEAGYFNEVVGYCMATSEPSLDSMDTDEPISFTGVEDRRLCYHLIDKYLREVLVRVRQYKDELLAACLELVLSVPRQFVDIPRLLPALQTAFRLGLSYPPLAVVGLDAVDRWLRALPLAELLPHLSAVLPWLAGYLQHRQHDDDAAGDGTKRKGAVDDAILRTSGRNKAWRIEKRRRAAEQQSADDDDVATVDTAAAEVAVRWRIVRLLGRLGGENIHMLGRVDLVAVDNGDTAGGNIAWDTAPRVQFVVPFHDRKVRVFLDQLLPRVVALAETASERQAKVAACELLHSLVLLMVGSNAHSPHAAKAADPTPYHKIYKRIFPALLRLSVDVDTVTRQLFEPLVFQLVHWFTKNAQSENVETMALLEAIVDAVGSPQQHAASLRDFAARCVAEFFQWSMKHGQTGGGGDTPVPGGVLNIKSLFKRLYSLAHHPNPYKRLGFAMTVLQLHRYFREEPLLVDMFVLELMDHLLVSLRLAHADSAYLDTAEKTATAVQSVAKIIAKCAATLNRPMKNRRRHKDLAAFVEWLFRETARKETRFRAECMTLFDMLVPLLSGGMMPADWVKAVPAAPPSKSGKARADDADRSRLASVFGPLLLETTNGPSNSGAEDLQAWYSALTTALEFLTWLLTTRYATPAVVHGLMQPSNTSKGMLSVLSLFCTRYAISGPHEDFTVQLTPHELDVYQQSKAAAVRALLTFTDTLLTKQGEGVEDILTGLLGEPLYRVLFTALLRPGAVGFAENDIARVREVGEQCGTICRKLLDNIDEDDLVPANRTLRSLLQDDMCQPQRLLDFACPSFNVQTALSLLHGYERLHAVGLLLPNLGAVPRSSSAHGAALAGQLAVAVFDQAEKLTPLQKMVALELLRLSFALGLGVDALISLLTDVTAMETDTPSTQRHTRGAVFYKQFQGVIDPHIAEHFAAYVTVIMNALSNPPSAGRSAPLMLRLLHNILDKYPKNEAIVTALLPHLTKLLPWVESPTSTTDDKESALELVRKLLRLHPAAILAPSSGGLTLAWAVFTSLLGRNSTLLLKGEALDLVPAFLAHLPPERLAEVKERLNDLVVNDFPVSSSDLPRGSVLFAEYIAALDKLLHALAHSQGTTLVLEVLYPVLKEPQHAHANAVDAALQQFIERQTDDQAKAVFDVCFSAFTDRYHHASLRLALARKLCIPLLAKMSTTLAAQAFTERISALMAIIQPANKAPATTQSVDDKKQELLEKACAFQFIEALYKTVPPSVIKENVNRVYAQSLGTEPKGNEFTTAVMRAAHAAKSEPVQWPPTAESSGDTTALHSLAREYYCAAYNALAWVIQRTQTRDKFFTVFFFKENPEKGEFIWKNIVDLDTVYQFPPYLRSEPPASSGDDSKEERETDDEQEERRSIRVAAMPQGNPRTDLRYLSSQYLADTSLSQDLSIMGSFFVAPSTQSTTTTTKSNNAASISGPSSTTSESATSTSTTVAPIEEPKLPDSVDPLNASPCMSTILRLIDHIHAKFITPPTKEDPEMPEWMAEVHAKFTASDTHPNIRLFLAKLLVNRPQIFAPYWRHWTGPLMELVMSPDNGGKGLHYFARELCMVLLQWPDCMPPRAATAEGKQLTSRFMNHLLRSAAHHEGAVMRTNLDIVKRFVERWHGLFTVNRKIISTYLSCDLSNKSWKPARTAGVYLLSILVHNGLPAYDPEVDAAELSEFKFYEALLSNLTLEGAKEITGATAQTVGMILRSQAQRQRGPTMLEQKLDERIKGMFARNKHDAVLHALCDIADWYPSFVDPYFVHVFAILPSLDIAGKNTALKLVQIRATEIPDLYLKLKPLLQGLLTHRNEDTQRLSLDILTSLLPRLDEGTLQSLLESLFAGFADHVSAELRGRFYDIVAWIYQHHHDGDLADHPAVREGLLKGLADESDLLRARLLEFWDHPDRLSDCTLERLHQLFRVAYVPSTEHHWLQYSSQLMLALCRRSPDWDSPLFPALPDCVFREYTIDASHQFRSFNMTPLFAPSPSQSGTSAAMPVDDDVDMVGAGLVRATQPPVFTATQSSDMPAGPLLVSQPRGPSVRPVDLAAQPAAAASSTVGTAAAGSVRPSTNPLLARTSSLALAGSAVGVSQSGRLERVPGFNSGQRMRWRQREAQQQRQKQSRANRVVMFRKYRTGELPDVQIRPRDVIEPLVALAKHDAAVAVGLFSLLFRGLLASVPDEARDGQRRSLNEAIAAVLRQSKGDPSVVACLQRICYDQPDMALPPQLVADTAVKSLNFHIGVLLLEKQLLQNGGAEADGGKTRQRAVDNGDQQQTWLQLAVMYKELKEFDVLLGLYEHHLARHRYTKEAISAEQKGDYATALHIYEQATLHVDEGREWSEGTAPSPQEVELWENGRLEALSKLLKWGDLVENTLAEVQQTPQQLWEPQYIRQSYLDYYLRGCFKLKDRWPELWAFLDEAPSSARPLLDERYSELLAAVAVSRGDFDRARFHVGRGYQGFASQWAALHPLALASKHYLLQGLEKLVEMEEFLEFVADEANLAEWPPVRRLLSAWRHRSPSPANDDINLWDDVTTNRALMLEKLYERFHAHWASGGEPMQISGTEPPLDLKELKEVLSRERAEVFRKMSTAARKQGNLFVADLYVRQAHKASKKALSFAFFYSLVKLYCLKARRSLQTDPLDAIDKFSKAISSMLSKRNEPYVVEDPRNVRRCLLLLAELYHESSALAVDHPDAATASLQQHGVFTSPLPSDPAGLLIQRAFQTYREAFDATDTDGSSDLHIQAKLHTKFAIFCDAVLRNSEDQPAKPSPSASESWRAQLPQAIVSHILDGMRLQSSAARDRFPRLLELLSHYPTTRETFTTKSQQVPIWMYIRWLAQMMASLAGTGGEGEAVVPLLVRLAQTYPQALYYPFKISTDNLPETVTKGTLAPVAAALRSPLLDGFVAALEKLTHPEHRWKDWLEALKPLLKDATARNPTAITGLFQKIYEDVFDPEQPLIGSYNRKFASKWAKTVAAMFGADGSKLVKADYNKFLKDVADLQGKMMAEMNPKQTAHMKLADFSEWLANFDLSEPSAGPSPSGASPAPSSLSFIELPGQYTGLCKPQPEHHIKVVSFDSDILVMGSIRRPKRLKLRGNDERDYPFLVKGGEDLRLDQRVQQLFSVMNALFEAHPGSSKRALRLATYGVVPMTNKVGMIQWVENTRPLKELIEEEIAKREQKSPKAISILKLPAAVLQEKWLQSFANKPLGKSNAKPRSNNELYHAMFIHASRADVIAKLEQQYASVPSDLLRCAIMSLAASPEAYLTIRSHFAKSLAVFSVSSYVIGIGDRHLENFLLSYSDGGLIGIDFGHAFGTATQFLPIPELIPFRLTRQLTNFLQPLDTEGLLKHNMVQALEALYKGRDILLNTLDVFIKEPLLDWEKLARRQAAEQTGAAESSGNAPQDPATRFHRRRIDIVKRKLAGTNPAHITVQELAESAHSKTAYYKALREIVLGKPEVNVRARIKEKCANAEEQAACLIDQATDPNILGRTYGGWAPWI